MKLTKLFLLFLFLSLKGFSQQAVLTSSGEKVILNFLSSLGGTITGTLVVTGNTTISGTTTLTGVNNTGTITNTGSLINNGKLIVGALSTASASAVLEVSSTSQGFLPPRMTIAQRDAISSTVAGLVMWCSNCGNYGELQVYNGTTWTNMIGGTAAVIPPTASLTGSQSICTGGTANLTLSLTGTGSITVTLNDGTAVTFNSGTTSGIITVTPSSATTYIISSVTDSYGNNGTSTGSATVNIYAPAAITVQPVSTVTIVEGTTTTLSVTATGQPSLGYQWYQDVSAISGANSYSYTTTNTTIAAGTYYVTVSTTCNVVSSTTATISVTAIYTIGQSALGGIIAYINGGGTTGTSGLVATVADISLGATWGCYGTTTGAGGTVIGTGNQNTINIMDGCATVGIAARLCGELVQGGYSDWYLPSKDELNKLYLNQTAIGGFNNNKYYWSSTEFDLNYAWKQYFSNGDQFSSHLKSTTSYVRAIRAF